jgi:hypothetical protein
MEKREEDDVDLAANRDLYIATKGGHERRRV